MQKYDIFSRLHNRHIRPRVALRLDSPSAVSVRYSTIPVGSPNLLEVVLGFKAPNYPDEFTPLGIFLAPPYLGHDGSGSNLEYNLTAFVQVLAMRIHITYKVARSLWVCSDENTAVLIVLPRVVPRRES